MPPGSAAAPRGAGSGTGALNSHLMKRRVRERIARGDGLTVLDLLEAFVFRGRARFVQDEPAILVERFFNKIKHCRRVATRYDKFAANYLAFVQLASIRLWLRVNESTLAMTSLAFCLRQASSARARAGLRFLPLSTSTNSPTRSPRKSPSNTSRYSTTICQPRRSAIWLRRLLWVSGTAAQGDASQAVSF